MDADIARRALERYAEWDLLTPCPYVWAARDADDAHAVRDQVAEMQALGLDVEAVEPTTLGARYPALDTDGLTACGVARSAGTVDPEAVVDTLAARARSAGATIRTGTPVSLAGPRTVETPDGVEPAESVVVAAGPATDTLVTDVGVPLALGTYRAQALVTTPLNQDLPSFYDASRECYWRPHGEGLLVGDGAHAVAPEHCDRDADESFVRSALARLSEATSLDEAPAVERAWAGCCTATPDRDPLVGPVADGLWVATGWQGHGLMRAPAIGEVVADGLCAETELDPRIRERFDPTRFDGDESFHPLGDPTSEWE
jgi:sarcosine oxidase subunit beta